MVPVSYEDSSHVYLDAQGKRLPSVTSIIREVFQTGSFGYSEDARMRGDAVHFACQLISEGRYVEQRVHPTIQPFGRAWRAYTLDCGYVSEWWERPLASRFGFAGKPDTKGAAGAGHEPMVLDVKSGQRPAWVGLQLAGYDMLIQENFSGTPKLKRRAVQLQADERYTVHTGVNIPGNGFVPFDDSRCEVWWASALNVYKSGLMKVQEKES